MNESFLTFDDSELQHRLLRVRLAMKSHGAEGVLVGTNANKLYLTGRIFAGYIYVGADNTMAFLLQRPTALHGPGVHTIRKVEDIPSVLAHAGITVGLNTALEMEDSYAAVCRMANALHISPGSNASLIMGDARMIKTDMEVAETQICGKKQTYVYGLIPQLYTSGMTDVELQIEIERRMRLEGGTGMLRLSGNSMEINTGSVLTGANADHPSPYDFALGGAGINPTLPIGANGTLIKPGLPVMVDMNGCFDAYQTDMTRVYSVGKISDEGQRAHNVSIAICHKLAQAAIPGRSCAELYDIAAEMATQNGLAEYFMGHRSHASFVGHGVGITVNERPVLYARSKDVLQKNMIIAIEPKFVIPGIGAVGIENTYVITDNGAVSLTNAPEQITELIV